MKKFSKTLAVMLSAVMLVSSVPTAVNHFDGENIVNAVGDSVQAEISPHTDSGDDLRMAYAIEQMVNWYIGDNDYYNKSYYPDELSQQMALIAENVGKGTLTAGIQTENVTNPSEEDIENIKNNIAFHKNEVEFIAYYRFSVNVYLDGEKLTDVCYICNPQQVYLTAPLDTLPEVSDPHYERMYNLYSFDRKTKSLRDKPDGNTFAVDFYGETEGLWALGCYNGGEYTIWFENIYDDTSSDFPYEFNFVSDDEEIPLSDFIDAPVYGTAYSYQYPWYKFLGWGKNIYNEETGDYETVVVNTVKKSDFDDDWKSFGLQAVYDMTAPKNSGTYYISLDYSKDLITFDSKSFTSYTLPTPELNENEIFLGWDVSFDDSTGEITKKVAVTKEDFKDSDFVQYKSYKVTVAVPDENGVYKWTYCLDANGGTLYGKEVEHYKDPSPYPSVIGVNMNDYFIPQRKGCRFKGWNTQKDGSGTYVNENYMMLSWRADETDENHNLTLYAQWEKKEISVKPYRNSQNDRFVASAVTKMLNNYLDDNEYYDSVWSYPPEVKEQVKLIADNMENGTVSADVEIEKVSAPPQEEIDAVLKNREIARDNADIFEYYRFAVKIYLDGEYLFDLTYIDEYCEIVIDPSIDSLPDTDPHYKRSYKLYSSVIVRKIADNVTSTSHQTKTAGINDREQFIVHFEKGVPGLWALGCYNSGEYTVNFGRWSDTLTINGRTCTGMKQSFNFISDDEEIDIEWLAGGIPEPEITKPYGTFKGWAVGVWNNETNGYDYTMYEVLKKSDFTNKEITLMPVFDYTLPEKDSGKYYVVLNLRKGTIPNERVVEDILNYCSFTVDKEELDSFEIPEPTADGEIFLGWNAQYDMELGKIVSHGNKLTEADFADSNIITLVASYKYPASADEKDIITLNANGGLMDGREVNYYHSAVHISSSPGYDLNLLVPEREGYQFTGWNTKADGTGDTVLNTDRNAYSVKDIVLYAQWKKAGIAGDVNGDGSADIADALMISRYDAGLIELDDAQKSLGDVNKDGETDIADALLISRYDAGLIDSLE